MADDRNMKEQPSIPSLLKVDDLANVLQVSIRSVRRMADQGLCPRPVKIGHAIRWERKVVEEWIASGCPRCRRLPGK